MRSIMTVARGLLVALAIVGAISGSTAADEAVDGHWKPPPVGTLLQYNYGESCRVIAVDEGRYFCKGDRNYWVRDVTWSVYRGMRSDVSNSDGSAVPVDKRAIDKLFPLEIGKTTIASLRIGKDVWKTKYKVTSFKTIKTLLGPRPVFGISYTETNKKAGYRGKGWGFLDAEFGFYHSGRHIEVSNENRTEDWRLFTLELPGTDGEN